MTHCVSEWKRLVRILFRIPIKFLTDANIKNKLKNLFASYFCIIHKVGPFPFNVLKII